ncbi:UNVERIFIED_CONTAM: hypothetical protein Slati_3062400 [Sesamum latifolium]|uniref:Retrotransposon gag domain-containing protein n=1 Tax=Sesamum latifolium TaxID=2727402 RepID=A0AAW2UU37_9LAMI
MPPNNFARYTPLKAPRAEILKVAEQQGIIPWPRKMKDNPKRLKSDKYCKFYKNRGHSTEDCYHLKNEVKELIQRGYLKEYMENKPPEHAFTHQRLNVGLEEAEGSRRREKGKENLPTTGVIEVVTGGPVGGDSARARKALMRATSTSQEIYDCREVIITETPEEKISFSSKDLEKGISPHNDALVISSTVSNFWVKKVLVDSESMKNILFFTAFSQMGIGANMLTKVNIPLVGFNGSVVEPLGEIALPNSIGTALHRATRMLNLFVVDAPSSYNIIMGGPSLNSFRSVASTYHMKLKFRTYRAIGEEKGDRRLPRECHPNIFKKKSNSPTERENQVTRKEENNGRMAMDMLHYRPRSDNPSNN